MFPVPIPYISQFTVLDFEIWVLMLVRISVIVFLLPLIGAQTVSPMIKVGLSAFLSFVLYPVLPQFTVNIPTGVPAFIVMAIKESMVGILMGSVSTVLFMGLGLSGRLVDFITGFSMAQSFNPLTDESESVMGQIQIAIFSMLLLVTNGHLIFVEAIAESFKSIPPTLAVFNMEGILQVMMSLITLSMIYGIKLAAPMLIPLLLTTIGLAIVARIMPQMNVWLVGMPLKIGLGLGTFAISMPLIWSVFQVHVGQISAHIPVLFRMMGGS